MSKAVPLSPELLEFLDLCPEVMLLFEIQGYRILAANAAAARQYGYAKDELARMTIMDLRLAEDVPRIARLASRMMDGPDAAGRSRHLKKGGEVFVADVHTQLLEVDGRLCKLAVLHDVTQLVAQENAARALLTEAAKRLRAADATADHFARLFNLAPGRCVVLRPGTFEVVAASDGYLETVGRQRTELVGRPLVLPGSAADPEADAFGPLRTALRRVAEAGRVEVLPDAAPWSNGASDTGGEVPLRGWTTVNLPLKGPDGSVVFIVHGLVASGGRDASSAAGSAMPETATLDELRRLNDRRQAHELNEMSRRLSEREALLRTAGRLLQVHEWQLDIASEQAEWSDGLFDLCGIPVSGRAPTLEAYAEMVHPDDRDAMMANLRAHLEGPDKTFTFAHRVVRPDGGIVHLRGAAERIAENGRHLLSGLVQDVTPEREAAAEARRQDYLLRIAGEVGRIGGWRVDVASGIAEWSQETANIHETPETRRIGVQQALGFYPPEHRAVIAGRVDACARHGTPFDEVLQIVNARGKHVWVRAIGAPEHDASGRIVAVQGALQDLSVVIMLHRQAEDLRGRLSRTLDSMNEAFLTLDRSCRFTYINRMAETLLRRGRDSLLGQEVWSEFPFALGTLFETELRRALETGESVRFDECFGSNSVWFRVTAHPSADGLAIHFRDITSDRARDQRLRLLDAAVVRMNDILLITEAQPLDAPDGPRIIYVNSAFERLTGYTADEVIGRTPRILQGPATDRAELDRLRGALQRGEPVRAEVVNYGRDGREITWEMDITPLSDSTGTPTHFVALQRDTTERRRAEAQLRLSEERFRLVTEATKDVIWDWDLQSGRWWWNDNLQRVFGHAPASPPVGGPEKEGLIHPEDAPRVVDGLRATVEGTERAWQDEYRLLRADGSTAHVQDRGIVLRDDRGRAMRMIGSIVDVTRERETVANLHQSQKLEALGQLTGGVAHDFNNLLTVIIGSAELLSERLADRQDLQAMAEMAVSAAERGAGLTGRLLAFARQQPLDPRVIDLNQAIRSILPLLRRSVGETIEVRVVPAIDPWSVEIDPGQFEAALLNLAINARDAMPSGGTLTIKTSNARMDADAAALAGVAQGQYVVVTVTDTGVGMPPEVVNRVLEPFYTRKRQGTGLGLPMAFGFTKQSGGHLKVFSEVGRGTSVRLYFPKSRSARTEQPETPITSEAPEGRGEHILVVEDDHVVRRNAIAMLRSLGYRISEAENASVALDLLDAEDDVDLLFTDIVMPGIMDGRALAEEALRRRPNLCVLYTSGYTENAFMRDGQLDPGVQLLSKPYRRRDLARKLRTVLDGT